MPKVQLFEALCNFASVLLAGLNPAAIMCMNEHPKLRFALL